MNWELLKNNECPKCGNTLMECSNGVQMGYECSTKGYECTFFIGQEKFEEIVNSLYRPRIRNEVEDNQAELNNL